MYVFSEENVCSGTSVDGNALRKRFKMSCSLVEKLNEDYNVPSEQSKQIAAIEKEFRMDCKLVEMESNGTKHCQEGWIPYQQSCYLFWNKTSLSFIAAASMCSQNGAHLVFVGTSAENDFIKQKLRTLPSNHWWMGITDVVKEGTYKYYRTNTSIVFPDWYSREPSNGDGAENCVHYFNT